MRILILSDDFPPFSQGGAGQAAFNLADGLKERGEEIFVVSTVQDKKKAGYFNSSLKHFSLYVPHYHERWKAYLGLYNPKAVSQVESIIKQLKPDVVHAHNLHYYLSYHCLKLAKRFSRAVFLTVHDVMPFHYGKLTEFIKPDDFSIPKEFNYRVSPWHQIKTFKRRYQPFRNIVIRHYLGYPDKIFAVSRALAEALAQNKIKNTVVVYNGLDLDKWQIEPVELDAFKRKYQLWDKKIIFFGGRLSGLKGGEKIIQALKIIRQKIPAVQLLVAGEKDRYAQTMLNLAQELTIADKIILTGWLGQEEIRLAYAASDLVIVPSICFDSFPTVNLEAMALGKPVIASCFGGSRELVQDGATGYIVNPFDIQKMAEKMIELLTNQAKAQQFGQKGYQRVRKAFSLEQQVEKTVQYYQQYAFGNKI